MSGFSRLHALLVNDDTLAQVCRDLPESACREQPRNYGMHVVSLSLTKIGEGLAVVVSQLGLLRRDSRQRRQAWSAPTSGGGSPTDQVVAC